MSADSTEIQLALRARAMAAAVCTTGAIALSATATGYARAAGSFLDDGFAPGMEVLGADFALSPNNGVRTITALTDTDMACAGTVAESADVRTLSVGFPAAIAYTLIGFTPPAGRGYVEEDFIPATNTLRGMTEGGLKEETGLYVLRFYGVADLGELGLARLADAVNDQFPPGLALPLASGRALHIRGDIAPTRGQIRAAAQPGYGLAVLTVPYRLLTV